MTMKVSDTESGNPLTHVDWSVIVTSPSGQEVYKSSTLHSHVGTLEINYAFLEPGENTVSVQVASLGPKMMGMDVPAMAQTRVFASGDPMMGWQSDPNFFFGTRNAEFTVDVASQGAVREVQGSEQGSVRLELSTNPEKVIVGQPATLILNVKNADTGEDVTHSEALVRMGQGLFKSFKSAQAASPMMPMMGSFHGHTGQMALTSIFPSAGMYILYVDVNSLPVSNFQFGQASTRFVVFVEQGEAASSQVSTEEPEPNHVAIVGQDAPFYSPSNLTVAAGTTVTFRNHDAILHTVTSTQAGADMQSPEPDGAFDTGVLGLGQEAQVTFDDPGTYKYYCTIHPFMRGSVTVTG
jgi:plastocyanin